MSKINKAMRYLGNLLLALVAVFSIQFMAAEHVSVKWVDMRYTVIFCLAVAAFMDCFAKPKQMIMYYIAPIVVSSMTVAVILNLSKGSKPLGVLVWKETGFFLLMFTIVSLVHYLTQSLVGKNRYVAHCTAVLQGIIFLYPLLFIIYYLLSSDLIDTNSIIAIYQTTPQESKAFINSIASPMALLAIMISVVGVYSFFYKHTKAVEFVTLKKRVPQVCLIGIATLFLFPNLNHSYVGRIVSNSTEYLSSVKNFKAYRQNSDGSVKLIEAATKLKNENQTFVLVIGESQNKDHLGAYGYARATSPWMSAMRYNNNFVFFENAYSSHTLTMKVLSRALTEANQYNQRDFAQAYSLVDIARAAGFNTTWISNQSRYGSFNTPITVISDMCAKQVWLNEEADSGNRYDEGVLEQLAKIPKSGRNLIIIHLNGSHYEYKDRYPQEFDKFIDASGIAEYNVRSVKTVNQYDNSVLYTDYILGGIYEYGVNEPNVAGIVYFSDHGEDVFSEKRHLPGVFTFGMARIPLVTYLSPQYQKQESEVFNSLQANSKAYFTNDLLYDTMLDIMRIETVHYDKENSLGSSKYRFKKEELTTLDGAIKISADVESRTFTY